MQPQNNPPKTSASQETSALCERVNEAMLQHSDKDMNYSRIRLMVKLLHDVDGPYALWFDILDVRADAGKSALKIATDEVTWGERHTNELGILEIISLRLNKALLQCTSDEFWGFSRPVLRIEKKEVLAQKGISAVLWYEVQEVGGEEFENR